MLKQIQARIPDPTFTELEFRASQLSNSCGKPVDSSKLMRLAVYRLLDDLKNSRSSIEAEFYKNANAYIKLQDALHQMKAFDLSTTTPKERSDYLNEIDKEINELNKEDEEK